MAWGNTKSANNGQPAPQPQQVKSHFHLMLEDVIEAQKAMEHFATCASSLTLIAQKHLNALDKIRIDLTSAIGEHAGVDPENVATVEQAMAEFVPKQYRTPQGEPDAGSREG